MLKYIPLILFTVLTNFLSQILLKKGMTQVSSEPLRLSSALSIVFETLSNVFVVGGLIVMVISMASHLFVLAKVDISYAYPFLGLSFVLITLWGHFVLAEPINLYKITGVALIVFGVALVAKS